MSRNGKRRTASSYDKKYELSEVKRRYVPQRKLLLMRRTPTRKESGDHAAKIRQSNLKFVGTKP